MTIQKVVTPSGEVNVTGSGYRPEGELRVDGGALDDPTLLEEVGAVIGGGSLANDASRLAGGRCWDRGRRWLMPALSAPNGPESTSNLRHSTGPGPRAERNGRGLSPGTARARAVPGKAQRAR